MSTGCRSAELGPETLKKLIVAERFSFFPQFIPRHRRHHQKEFVRLLSRHKRADSAESWERCLTRASGCAEKRACLLARVFP
jgi:hypothetical protein